MVVVSVVVVSVAAVVNVNVNVINFVVAVVVVVVVAYVAVAAIVAFFLAPMAFIFNFSPLPQSAHMTIRSSPLYLLDREREVMQDTNPWLWMAFSNILAFFEVLLDLNQVVSNHLRDENQTP